MTIRSRLLLLLLPPLTAFLLLAFFFFYFNWSREILLMGSCLTLLLVFGTVFVIADRISKPVRQLNQAALEIAAGDYEANIQVKGPREIMELAHTLNTMSQCLVEHMSRLRESSLIRERMYGEYECALLLQHYMLQKVIEDFNHSHISLRLISVPLSPLQKGLFLKVSSSCQLNSEHLSCVKTSLLKRCKWVNIKSILTQFQHLKGKTFQSNSNVKNSTGREKGLPPSCDLILTLLEAQEQGFAGLFQLNQWVHLPKKEFKDKSFIECQFIDQYRILRYYTHKLFPPLVWSIKAQQFVKSESQDIPLQNRDMIFLYNSSLVEQFETEEAIERWFAKVLRHFAEDGLDTIHVMLTNELTFLAKKQHTKHNFKIISLQIKITDN